ncbi:MAG: hypothetical protein ABSG00_05705 [Terracidiphilus sp.]
MRRACITQSLLVALLASAAAGAAPAANLRAGAAPVAFSGVYSLTFHLTLASQLPAGSTITCRAQIAPWQSGLDLLHPPAPATPVIATGRVAVTGSTATCAAEIPFAWMLTGGAGGVTLSYEIEAVSSAGTVPLLLRRSPQERLSAALPPEGGSASLSFNLIF